MEHLPVPDHAVLDMAVMDSIRALGAPGEPDVFAEVARLFLADVPVHLAALDNAIAEASPERVWQIAHRLRGGALEMGALTMAPVCAELEHEARAGSLAHAGARAAKLADAFALTQAALKQAID